MFPRRDGRTERGLRDKTMSSKKCSCARPRYWPSLQRDLHRVALRYGIMPWPLPDDQLLQAVREAGQADALEVMLALVYGQPYRVTAPPIALGLRNGSLVYVQSNGDRWTAEQWRQAEQALQEQGLPATNPATFACLDLTVQQLQRCPDEVK